MSDIFGIKSYGDALNSAVSKSLEGVGTFLSIVCRPALEEVGMMLQDKVKTWRLKNVIKILEKAEGKLEWKDGKIDLVANPKVALAIIESGANEDDDDLQDLWAGLFASSITNDGKDDGNLIYVNTLKQITVHEAMFFRHICLKAKKFLYPTGVVKAQMFSMYGREITEITGITDANKQEAIIFHLNSLNILGETGDMKVPSGFKSANWNGDTLAWISLTNFALQLFAKCHGAGDNSCDFWTKQEGKLEKI